MLRWAVLSLLAVTPDERIRVEVVYDAPEACPPKARLEAELRARSATSGAVDGVLAAGVAVRLGSVRLALSPRLTPGRRLSSTAGDAAVLSGGARLDALGSFSVGGLRLEAGVMLEVLAVSASAPGAEVPGQALGLLVAPGPLGRVVLVVGPLRVALEGGLGVNTRIERFLIEGAGPVFQAPRVFGFGAGVVGVAF